MVSAREEGIMFKKKSEVSGVTVKTSKYGVTVKANMRSDDLTMLVVGTGAVALIDAIGPSAAALAADGIRAGSRLASKGIKAVGQAAKAAIETQRDKAAVKKAAKQQAAKATGENQQEADQ